MYTPLSMGYQNYKIEYKVCDFQDIVKNVQVGETDSAYVFKNSSGYVILIVQKDVVNCIREVEGNK